MEREARSKILYTRVTPETQRRLDRYIQALRESGWTEITPSDVLNKALVELLGSSQAAQTSEQANA